MHNEAGDLYELGGARAPGPPGPPVPDGAPAPCPANPGRTDIFVLVWDELNAVLTFCDIPLSLPKKCIN